MDLLAHARALECAGRDIVHMEIGEPDFPTPQAVINAAATAIKKGAVKYTPAAGLPELRVAISEYYKKRYGVNVAEQRVFVTPGASGALLLAFAALVNPGDEVLLLDPGYPCYRNLVCMFDGVPKLVPVDSQTNFQWTARVVKENWGARVAGVLVSSPANPTGTVVKSDVLREICDLLAHFGGFLISDEIYHGLEYGERSVSALEFSPNALVINSFSKYFGMTGWRLGWIIVPDELVKAVDKLIQNAFIAAPTHSQYAALAAFSDDNVGDLELRRLEFEGRRDYLFAELESIGFAIRAKPQGAFYLYADCSRFSGDSVVFSEKLLEYAGVAVTPGWDFGEHCARNYLRFAYTASLDRLKEGINRLKNYLLHSL